MSAERLPILTQHSVDLVDRVGHSAVLPWCVHIHQDQQPPANALQPPERAVRHEPVGEHEQTVSTFLGPIQHPVEVRVQRRLSPEQADLVDA